jgi:hypothetical protein
MATGERIASFWQNETKVRAFGRMKPRSMTSLGVLMERGTTHVSVVPAKAGTHTPCPRDWSAACDQASLLVIMGPRLRGTTAETFGETKPAD